MIGPRMQIEQDTFYVVGPTEFRQLLLDRVRNLEGALVGVVLDQTEIVASRNAAADHAYATPELEDTLLKREEALGQQAAEIRYRINALRSLASGELDEPKGE